MQSFQHCLRGGILWDRRIWLFFLRTLFYTFPEGEHCILLLLLEQVRFFLYGPLLFLLLRLALRSRFLAMRRRGLLFSHLCRRAAAVLFAFLRTRHPFLLLNKAVQYIFHFLLFLRFLDRLENPFQHDERIYQ